MIISLKQADIGIDQYIRETRQLEIQKHTIDSKNLKTTQP